MSLTTVFTDKYIQGLQPRDKRYYTREGNGFAVRVQPSGLKTFFLIYTSNGKRKHKNLGDFPLTSVLQARVNAGIESEPVQLVPITPVNVTPVNTPVEIPLDMTFKHFSDLFLAWSEKHHSPEWHKINALSLKNDVLPFWSAFAITGIRRRDAIAMLERVAKRSPGQASNVHKAARGVFDYAVQREYLEYNPMLKLMRVVPDLKDIARDRVLNDAELRCVWNSLPDTSTGRALRFIICTALRPGEAAGLHRREIQGDTMRIPRERAEKGRGAHVLHLTGTALGLLGTSEEYIFGVTRHALSKYLCRKEFFGLPRFTPHDLRRTARTYFSKLGILTDVSEAILNHAKQGMVKVYDQYEYQHEKKAALIKWEAELLRIVLS